MHFSDLISPIPVERFMGDYFGRRPLHVPAKTSESSKAPVDWARLNELLAIRSHWTDANLKLVLNSRPIAPDFYMEEITTLGGSGRRADPAQVDVFLAMGASLVANSVEDLSPEVRAICSALGDQFSGKAGANIYCSFKDIQAFPSHCDLHEVFALQCEGEKIWNIYKNRAVAPVEILTSPDAQERINAVKGELLLQIRMRPGDLLYIPRGFYHDALASSGASLHVTLSVAPLTGRILFRLLEQVAIQDAEFREYLPDSRIADGKLLSGHLAALSTKLSAILTSGAFGNEVASRQRQLWEPDYSFSLPKQHRLEFYARSDRPAQVETRPAGDVLISREAEIRLGPLGTAVEWLLSRQAFSLQELYANYRHLDAAMLRDTVSQLERLQIVFRYEPDL